jgi:hypothetical protein
MKIKQEYYFLGAAAIIFIYYIFSRRKAAAEAEKEREETIRISEQISTEISTGGNSASFNGKPFAEKLKSDFAAYTADTALYDELLKLKDSEIRSIWLAYDERLKNSEPQKGKTLGLALYDSYSFTRSFTFGWDWTYHAKPFYDKLIQLGLP